jgi:hypothetical protein
MPDYNKYTRQDYEDARSLFEVSGNNGPSLHPGYYYIAKMAEIVATIRLRYENK